MLSRTAENLYWACRYIERAEMLARLIDVGYRITITKKISKDNNIIITTGLYSNDLIKRLVSDSKIIIKKNMGWCDDIRFPNKYNKLFKIEKKIKHEKLKRIDYKYDFLIPIKYNFNKPVTGKGSCIFIHLTKNYKPTAGCIALKEKDFLIMLKLIKKNSKIKIF